MLNIALPKGRLGEKIYGMFSSIGLSSIEMTADSRKLIFESDNGAVKYFWVKPSDVQIYVEYGAADIGVAGKDILLEYNPDVYELLDLKTGICRMATAAMNGYKEDVSRPLRVATKFPTITRNYYSSKNRAIEIICLNGSIELAPVLGLSDIIVDIVETGTTLKENNLSVLEDILPISARFISNKSSYKFKRNEIDGIVEKLSAMVK